MQAHVFRFTPQEQTSSDHFAATSIAPIQPPVVALPARWSKIALHIGARVAALAAPGEVLVSQTVRDLVAGLELWNRVVYSQRMWNATTGCLVW